jgi:hypothetical protein
MAETEAMVGADNNPPKSGSNIGRNISHGGIDVAVIAAVVDKQ